MPESALSVRPVHEAAFARELDALLVETRAGLGQDDLDHLARIEWWGRACTAAGYATVAGAEHRDPHRVGVANR